MQFFGWTLADRHAGNELPQYSADRQAGNGAELPEPLTLHFGEPHGHHVFFVRSLTLLSAVFAAKLSARRRHWGLGRAPASAFVIQTLCLRQRRPRRRWLSPRCAGLYFQAVLVIAILCGHCPLPRKKEIISPELDAGKGTFRLRVPSEYPPMRERSFQG